MSTPFFRTLNSMAVLKWCFAFIISPGSLFLWGYLIFYSSINLLLEKQSLEMQGEPKAQVHSPNELKIASLSTDFWLRDVYAHHLTQYIQSADSQEVWISSPCIRFRGVDFFSLIQVLLNNESLNPFLFQFEQLSASCLIYTFNDLIHQKKSKVEFSDVALSYNYTEKLASQLHSPWFDRNKCAPLNPSLNRKGFMHASTHFKYNEASLYTNGVIKLNQSLNHDIDRSKSPNHSPIYFQLSLQPNNTYLMLRVNFETQSHSNRLYQNQFSLGYLESGLNNNFTKLQTWQLASIGLGLKNLLSDSLSLKHIFYE